VRCEVDFYVSPASLAEPAKFVMEELLTSVGLSCPGLRISYGPVEDGPSPWLGPSQPWVHIRNAPSTQFSTTPRELVVHEGVAIPAIGSSGQTPIIGHSPVTITFDLIATAFFFLAGLDTQSRGLDVAGRPRYVGSVMASLRSRVPPVNALLEVLADALRRAGARLVRPDAPGLCVTHDHDVTLRSLRGRLWGALRQLGGAPPALSYIVHGVNTLEELTRWESQNQVPSTTFAWAGPSRGPLDRSTDTIGLARVLRPEDTRVEVALHASSHTLTSDWSLERQARDLVELVGIRPRGVRMHNLIFDIERTSIQIEEARLDYDSSLAYPDFPAFATGFTYPHRLYSARLGRPFQFLEVPLFAMDESFRKYLLAPADEMEAAIVEAGDLVAVYGGTLTLLWHHHLGDDRFASGYGRRLRSSVMRLRERGLRPTTVSDAVRKRRAAYARVLVRVRS